MTIDESTGQSTTSTPTGPRRSNIRHIRFDKDAIDLIAETVGGTAGNAPFRLPNATVYQIVVPDKEGKPAVMLTLWPSIRRVDAIATASTIVFTDVSTIDLVTEVEVQFRRANRDLLIVARGGKVIIRA
jgi:hypothetical protein